MPYDGRNRRARVVVATPSHFEPAEIRALPPRAPRGRGSEKPARRGGVAAEVPVGTLPGFIRDPEGAPGGDRAGDGDPVGLDPVEAPAAGGDQVGRRLCPAPP